MLYSLLFFFCFWNFLPNGCYFHYRIALISIWTTSFSWLRANNTIRIKITSWQLWHCGTLPEHISLCSSTHFLVWSPLPRRNFKFLSFCWFSGPQKCVELHTKYKPILRIASHIFHCHHSSCFTFFMGARKHICSGLLFCGIYCFLSVHSNFFPSLD